MLILSQDKNKIVNLDNVIYITTNTYSEECSGISCNSLNNLEIYLGNYDTEERAKEVLQEIFKAYRLNKMLECSDRIEQVETLKAILKENMQPFIYEIPEE